MDNSSSSGFLIDEALQCLQVKLHAWVSSQATNLGLNFFIFIPTKHVFLNKSLFLVSIKTIYIPKLN